jgi:hypothetical protein
VPEDATAKFSHAKVNRKRISLKKLPNGMIEIAGEGSAQKPMRWTLDKA